MKEKICLIESFPGTNQVCITIDPNHSVLQCNGNIPVHLQSKRSKFKVTPSAEKVMLPVFWNYQGVLLAHFPNHGQNVISESYCEILSKLWDGIRRNRPGQLARGVLLHHDNTKPHTARVAQEGIQELQRELLEHRPYNPALAPSDFHVVGPLTKIPWWRKFRWWRRGWNGGAEVTDTTVKSLLCCRFRRTGKGMVQVYQCLWRIYREINAFFQVRISHVLLFKSICVFTDSPTYMTTPFCLLCLTC
jgi:hypothetical protein